MDFSLISKVELINDDGKSTLGTIQDRNENKIFVSLTLDTKKFKLLRAGDLVRGIITDKDKVLGFNGVVNRRIHGEIPMYEIIYEDLTKIQRREDFRMECSIPVKEGLIADISGGGVRLLSNEEFHKGSNILLDFKINEQEMKLNGEIVHVGDNDSPNGMKYGYGVKFKKIRDKEREIIIRNIFLLMRKRIQK